MKEKIFKIIALLLLFLAPLFLMSYDDTKDFETAKNLDIFYSLFTNIENSYVDEIAPGDLMSRTIDEMLKSLDPYTNFIPESDVEKYTVMTKGEYGGIGASVVQRDGFLMIMDIRKKSPAEKSGLLLGDIITEVDGHSIQNEDFENSMNLLQGEVGSVLKLGILRNKQHLNFSIERENIKISSVPYYGMVSQDVGYVKLNEFSQNCSVDVLKAVAQLKEKEGAKALILDLRDNPGGLLIEAVKIVNIFVPAGERVVYTRGNNKTENNKFSTIAEAYDREIPLVVLVNEHSASASEIVSGALQDFDRAVIVGRQSFGKGLVQTRKELAHNCLLKITTAKYYIPSGRCIQKLDYTHRDKSGNPTITPDSLQKTFYTKNHRPVKNAGGIVPDVMVGEKPTSPLLQKLTTDFVLFDFINRNYSVKDTATIKPQTYSYSQVDFAKFMSFIKEQSYTYHSESEQFLDSLMCHTKKEQLHLDAQIQELRSQIAVQNAKLYDDNKELIQKELASYIIRTLYAEAGQTEYLIRDDEFITEGLKYLADKDLYKKTLNP